MLAADTEGTKHKGRQLPFENITNWCSCFHICIEITFICCSQIVCMRVSAPENWNRKGKFKIFIYHSLTIPLPSRVTCQSTRALCWRKRAASLCIFSVLFGLNCDDKQWEILSQWRHQPCHRLWQAADSEFFQFNLPSGLPAAIKHSSRTHFTTTTK